MIRRYLILAFVILSTGCGPTTDADSVDSSTNLGSRHTMSKLSYPKTHTVDQVDTFHGVQVSDPYRWMEDIGSADTRAWIEAQNAVTREFIDAIPGRDALRDRMRELVDFARMGAPEQAGDKFYTWHNTGLQDQSVLYQADKPGGLDRVMIDPNLWPADEARSIRGTDFSPCGKYMAWATSKAGSDWTEWRIRDLESNQDLDDHIQHTKTGGVAWTQDSRGFFYSRHAEPTPGQEYTEANTNQTVWFHTLGTAQSEDVKVYDDPESPNVRPWIGETECGNWHVMYLFDQYRQGNRIMFRSARESNGRWIDLFPPYDGQWTFIGSDMNSIWLRTNNGAPRGRVVRIKAQGTSSGAYLPTDPDTVIPEGQYPLGSVSLAGDRLILTTVRDCRTFAELYAIDGSQIAEVPLPGAGTASGFDGLRKQTTRYFTYTDAVTPAMVYSLNTLTNEVSEVWRPELKADLSRFETYQRFFTNRDGLRVMLFVSHKKGMKLDGSNPTILYGYGGFNHSVRSNFSSTRIAWLERGGVFVQACLRGDGDYGQAWHMAANRINKQRTFDDFIGAAEHLIAEGYCKPATLAIQGGSNGGLLVGACMNQRPDLFAVCLPAVGVMDMLRFHRFTVGAGWIREYGTPDDPLEFQVLHAISPYHALKPGTKYPAVLVTTSDHDDRVVPSHSYKYAARLQVCQAGDAPVLVRIQTKGGHGGGTRLSDALEQAADQYAFVLKAMGR